MRTVQEIANEMAELQVRMNALTLELKKATEPELGTMITYNGSEGELRIVDVKGKLEDLYQPEVRTKVVTVKFRNSDKTYDYLIETNMTKDELTEVEVPTKYGRKYVTVEVVDMFDDVEMYEMNGGLDVTSMRYAQV